MNVRNKPNNHEKNLNATYDAKEFYRRTAEAGLVKAEELLPGDLVLDLMRNEWCEVQRVEKNEARGCRWLS